jgi:hydroxymethylbilane synthase
MRGKFMKPLQIKDLTLGSRPSKLAMWQTNLVRGQLSAAWPGLQCHVVTLITEGDKNLEKPLPEIGGKGLFTSELEGSLRSGEIDLAVHSLKDLPIDDSPGLCILAVSKRANARDILISRAGWRLDTLPQGACVGTSSLRRAAQLLATRPDLKLLPLRGNVDTRLRKAMEGQFDAIVLAAAGVLRLGLEEHVTEYLSFEVMLPAPGQGALAIQGRAGDPDLEELLAPLNDPVTRAAVSAERAFLAGLGGGCSAPVAAYAQAEGSGLRLNGLVAAVDGTRVVRVSGAGLDPAVLGRRLADEALAQGAGAILQ